MKLLFHLEGKTRINKLGEMLLCLLKIYLRWNFPVCKWWTSLGAKKGIAKSVIIEQH